MSRRFLLATAVAAALAVPSVVHATVGGPLTVEVLGYAPVDGKIYWRVWNEDSGDEPASIWFARVDGPHAGRAFEVKSWWKPRPGEENDWDAVVARVDARVDRLQRNLAPLDDRTRSWRVTRTSTRRSTWDNQEYGPMKQYDSECAVTDGSRVATTSVTTYGSPRVEVATAQFVSPDGPGVVVVRGVGIPWEGGYDLDTVVNVLAP